MLIEGVHVHVLALTIILNDASVGMNLASDKDLEIATSISTWLFNLPQFVNVTNSGGLLSWVLDEWILFIKVNLSGNILGQ
jgi:hypothetical protein